MTFSATDIKVCYMIPCSDCKGGSRGFRISDVSNQLLLSGKPGDFAPATEVSLTLAVSVFLMGDRKRTMPLIVTVIDPQKREEALTSFHVELSVEHSVDTRVLSLAINMRGPGIHWIKLSSTQHELHRVPLDISFQNRRGVRRATVSSASSLV